MTPGFVRIDFVDTVSDPAVRAQLEEARDRFAVPLGAIAQAIAVAIQQPDDVDVGEIIVRRTAQG